MNLKDINKVALVCIFSFFFTCNLVSSEQEEYRIFYCSQKGISFDRNEQPLVCSKGIDLLIVQRDDDKARARWRVYGCDRLDSNLLRFVAVEYMKHRAQMGLESTSSDNTPFAVTASQFRRLKDFYDLTTEESSGRRALQKSWLDAMRFASGWHEAIKCIPNFQSCAPTPNGRTPSGSPGKNTGHHVRVCYEDGFADKQSVGDRIKQLQNHEKPEASVYILHRKTNENIDRYSMCFTGNLDHSVVNYLGQDSSHFIKECVARGIQESKKLKVLLPDFDTKKPASDGNSSDALEQGAEKLEEN